MKKVQVGSKIWHYAVAGFIFGLFFPAFAYVMALQEKGHTVNITNILDLHARENIFFIIDLAPFVLAILFSVLGRYMSHQLQYLASLAQLEKSLREKDYDNSQKYSLLRIRRTYVAVFTIAGSLIVIGTIMIIFQFEKERQQSENFKAVSGLMYNAGSWYHENVIQHDAIFELKKCRQIITENHHSSEISKIDSLIHQIEVLLPAGKPEDVFPLVMETSAQLANSILAKAANGPLTITLFCSLFVLIILTLFVYTHFFVFAPNFMLLQKAILENTAARHFIRQQAEKLEVSQADNEEHIKQLHLNLKTAGYIRKSIQHNESYLQSVFRDSFLIDKPLQTLSGDFLWTRNFGDKKSFIVVGDCMGHGVAGTLLSMLYTNMLENLCTENISPEQLLLELDKSVKNYFQSHQSNQDFTCEAGVLCIDHISNQIQFAGSNIDLYTAGPQPMIYRGQRFSVGSSMNQEQPLLVNLKDTSEKWLIMCTDGFKNMLNQKQERMGLKKTIDILMDSGKKDGNELHGYLNVLIDTFRSDAVLTDDILVAGIKLK